MFFVQEWAKRRWNKQNQQHSPASSTQGVKRRSAHRPAPPPNFTTRAAAAAPKPPLENAATETALPPLSVETGPQVNPELQQIHDELEKRESAKYLCCVCTQILIEDPQEEKDEVKSHNSVSLFQNERSHSQRDCQSLMPAVSKVRCISQTHWRACGQGNRAASSCPSGAATSRGRCPSSSSSAAAPSPSFTASRGCTFCFCPQGRIS